MSETSQQEVEVQTEAKTHNEDERSRSQDVTDQNKSRGAPTTADVEPLVLEVLKKMVRTAIAEECAAKSPAGGPLGTSSDQTPQAPDKAQPEDLAKDTSSTPSPPHSSSPVELVQQIITILKQSTIVRPDQDIRSRFWKLYKTEAEEFHVDFIKKYGEELDISLIFAGLFSAVSATFVTALQSNLAADPNATTQVLLMMIVRSLNSTAFPGQDLILPQFTGPDRTTIWVQSLLYASLGASLFAALAAMLGKEWVGHYARVGDSGSIEDRCIDRQSKLIAMRAWRFDMVLACIPLLLQGSLLLFGVALSVYMWSQQHVIAGVIVAVNVVGVLLYGVLLMCSLVFPDCPYHIPLTDLTMAARDRLLPHLLQVTSSITQMVSYLFLKRELESPPTLPITAPAITNITAAVVKPNARLQLDAPCVEWLLMTSTDPEALIAAARMALEVDLAQVKFDPTAVQQLDKMFRSCFVSPESSSSGAHELLPSNYERAAVYGQALLGIYLDRHLMHSTIKSTLDPPDFGWLHRTAKLIQDHPDSRFISRSATSIQGTPHLDSSFYDSLSFLASHTIPIVRYAALKIIRNLCGDTEGEVDQGSLEGLVENMGDIDKFCAVLSSCAPEMRRPEDENDYIIRSTRVYLELVGGLCGSWMEHFRRQYAPQLMAIADNLATNSDGDVDWGLCEEHEPGFIQHLPSTSSAHEAELKLDIARTPWWSGFSDSDAHPHSCIPVMVKYTVDTWARQKLLEGHVLRGLRWLRYDLKDRIDEGVLGNQSKAMLDAACGVWDKLQPLFVQAGLEEGSENKEEGEMIIEEGEGEEVDDTDMVQKEGQADKDQSKETKAEHENESEHEEAAAIESIPPTTGVVYDLEAGGDA
ncbi:hypothetical protein EUX98_g6650 [Antrodiella citrinella]|uniref:DUF6535 domain-containing protein n=1 Tax=Antrodiella citrinella TaxID=2447956 RepID=A0A4S4MNR8_9APHY|nr:hypothetical protein EUX98_g6650 [Antrodiella citrinella]